ncbi:hypothetical protein ACFL1X_06580, partial [Candidatus Hydrogenedentota bacterium]
MKSIDLKNLLSSVSAEGGVIELPAGVHEVNEPLVLDVPNVTIKGNGTRLIVKSSGAQADFLQATPNVSNLNITDISFEWHRAKSSDLIQTAGADIRLTNCDFRVKSSDDLKKWGAFFHQVGGESRKLQRGIWVSNCRFELGPYVIGVHLAKVRSVYFSGNLFNGGLSGPCRGIWCQGENYLQITGNSFTDFSYRNLPDPVEAVFIDNPWGDLGHLEITGNHFHTIFGENSCAIRLKRHVYGTISGNVFGRVQGQGNAAIELEEAGSTNI